MFKDIFKNEKFKIAFILIIAFVFRFLFASDVPTIHSDEQYAFYSAKCLLEYGQDIWGHHLPVYSEAWGGGMSMGYIYLSIPFMFLLGKNILAYRLPMILGGVTATYFIYKIGEFKDKRTGFIMSILYAVMPWSVLQQRWGLDCNIFIILFIPALYFIIKYINERAQKYLLISLTLFGLSLWGYALAYVFVPVFLLVVIIGLLIKKRFYIKDWIIPSLILMILALPLMVFVFSNMFDLNIRKFLFFDIPKMYQFRNNEFELTVNHIRYLVRALFTQDEIWVSGSMQPWGLMFPTTGVFIFYGLYLSIKDFKNPFGHWMNVLFVFSFIFCATLNGIVGHKYTLLMIPSLYYVALSFEKLFNFNLLKKVIIVAYVLLAIVSFGDYLMNYNEVISTFKYNPLLYQLSPAGLDKVIEYSEVNHAGEEIAVFDTAHFTTPVYLNELNIDPTKDRYEMMEISTLNGNRKEFSKIENYQFIALDEKSRPIGADGLVDITKYNYVISHCNNDLSEWYEVEFKEKGYCFHVNKSINDNNDCE